MTTEEWIYRCSLRLHQQWPSLSVADMDDVARELVAEPRWRDLAPDVAAVEWLRQGIPTVA